MRLFLKITLIIIAIVLLIIIICGTIVGVTAYQGYQLYKSFKESNIQSDLGDIAKGDCSKEPLVEAKYADLKQKSQSSCRNKIIRFAIKKAGLDLCYLIVDNSSELDNDLQTIKSYCSFLNNVSLSGTEVNLTKINVEIPEDLKERFSQIGQSLSRKFNSG
jgi:hypothetical protein